MKVLITGGSGLIGKALTKRLLEEGAFDKKLEDITIDNKTYYCI
jgi:nucleoside-diphosphate-sugar epimerase